MAWAAPPVPSRGGPLPRPCSWVPPPQSAARAARRRPRRRRGARALQKTLPSARHRWPPTRAVVGNDLHLLRIGCGGGAAESAGEDRAHCAGCHVSFDSIALFDVHRDGGVVCGYQVLGLVATKKGICGCTPRIAVWPVEPRRAGAAAGSPLNLSPSPRRPLWPQRGRRSCRARCLSSFDPRARCDSLTSTSGADLEHRPASGCVEVR